MNNQELINEVKVLICEYYGPRLQRYRLLKEIDKLLLEESE